VLGIPYIIKSPQEINTLNNNGHDIWAYNNTNVINRDVYGLITDIYNAVCKKDKNE
jgi:hypothetical protein